MPHRKLCLMSFGHSFRLRHRGCTGVILLCGREAGLNEAAFVEQLEGQIDYSNVSIQYFLIQEIFPEQSPNFLH